MISERVMDAIAQIEAHRQGMTRESNVAAACNEALRRLHELLDEERKRLQSAGPGAEHADDIKAVTAEIERVRRLTGAAGKGAMRGHERPQRPRGMRPDQPHNRPRTKGRRTMGRTSGR
jgi:hypothetical protein